MEFGRKLGTSTSELELAPVFPYQRSDISTVRLHACWLFFWLCTLTLLDKINWKHVMFYNWHTLNVRSPETK
jgi:hypothetical protein